MSKNAQTAQIEGPEAHAAGVETPEDGLFCTVQLLVDTCYNGRSFPAGTLIGAVPRATAEKMAGFRTAQIIGAPHSINSQRAVRDPNAIENRLPSGLDPSQWEAAFPIVGQRSTTFINRAELDALRDQR